MESKPYIWKTASVIRETKEAVTIVFDTNGQKFLYQPGQFINVRLMIDGEAVSRSYSLSSSPDEDEKPSITVKKVENGIMSGYIFHHAEEVINWAVEGPFGFFHPTEDTLNSSRIVLIAAGSGISPIFSILKYLLRQTACSVSLIYSTKSWEDTIFSRVLLYMESIFPGRFSVHFLFTENEGVRGFQGANYSKGRLNRLVLKKLLKSCLGEQVNKAHYFVCGPIGFIKTAEETLAAIEVNSARVHKEYYSAPEETNAAVVLPDKKLDVLFHFHDQTNLLEITPGKTVLEAALEDKIQVPYSCRTGTCGVCAARLTSGKVHMQKNFALSQAQLTEGLILLCQSHPVDEQVNVEIGT